ncbi:MAG: DUF3999 family protein [Silanimonas sp.]
MNRTSMSPQPPSRQRVTSWRVAAGAAGLALLGALAAGAVVASDDDFAMAFPIAAPEGEPLFAIELPPQAYATLTTPDLRDLVVIDAEGREQAISLHRPPPPPPPQEPLAIRVALPIPVPGDAAATPGTLELHVHRDADGRLGAVDLRSVDALAGASTPPEWLIDVGAAAREGIDGLRLTPARPDDFRTLVDVRSSDDLVHWQTLQTALPLLRASSGGRAIERLDLRFARTTHRYLALRPSSGASALPAVSDVSALRRREAESAPLSMLILEPRGVSEDGRRIDYGRPGPLPVQQAEVRLAGGDGIVGFELEQQSGERWLPVLVGSVWRLSIGGETLGSPAVDLRLPGTGPLRVQLAQAAPPPRLVLGYHPDRVLVLASGTPPYRLLVGSLRRRHAGVAMGDTLAAIRARQGEEWQPPLATLGPAQPLAGAAALSPQADPGRIGLWLVLGLGAVVVGGLAWRLLKTAPQETA